MIDQLINFWNHLPEHINPVFFQIGQFQIRYYGLMYVVAFAIVYLLACYRAREDEYHYSSEIIQNYLVWAILGVMAGGRLGYVLFYNLDYYVSHPLEIILPFSVTDGFRYTGIGGMSFHGGLIGVLLASFVFCYRNKINFWNFTEFLVPVIPLGYTFGRVGNFLNGELYGRVTSMPWGMYFPLDPAGQLRHPSQLYEAFFEGIFLFIILWSVRKQSLFDGFLLSLYLLGYGAVRFFIEFVREPDEQLGFILGTLTMGQVLCLVMMASGAAVFLLRRH